MSTQSAAALIASLARIVGERNVQAVGPDPASELSSFVVDGKSPQVVVHPGSIEQLSQVMAYCHQQERAVIPIGGGTQLGLGEPPDRYDVAVCLSRLDRIVAHEPDDMTVTVEAGVTLAQLQDHLAQAGQVLPLDPPLPAEATIGGVLATRAAGPVQLAFRGISDHLLGIKVVNAQGTVTKSGGRVVKNVSGYEMGRIYTGSMGTLAIIVEATFKVRPRLEKGAALVVRVDGFDHADRVIQTLLHSDAEPTFLELLGPRPLTIIAGYTGTDEEVAWQIDHASSQLRAHRPETTPGESRTGSAHDDSHDDWLARIPWSTAHALVLKAHRYDASPSVFPGVIHDYVHDDTANGAWYAGLSAAIRAAIDSPAVITCTVSLLVSQVGRFLQTVWDDALANDIPISFACHAGTGVVDLHLLDEVLSADRSDVAVATDQPPGDRARTTVSPEVVASIVERWREAAHAVQGQLVVRSAPAGLKQELSIWGPTRQDFFLHRAIKEKLDPKRILNPGRFIGKI